MGPTMSKDKDKDKNADVAKHIWLAGLGAYGKALDDAVTRFDKAGKETPKLFKDLVKKGLELEKETREKIKPVDTTTARTSLEDRIKKMRSNFSMGLGGTSGDDIERIEQKIDALGRKVDKLARQLDSKPAAKAKTKAKTKAKAKKSPAKKKAGK